MNILPVENFLNGMSLVPLKCLTPDRQPYIAMLLQPDGPIEGTASRVGHKNQTRGENLSRVFLSHSIDELAELVVAPEYCVSWSVVTEVGANGKMQPSMGSIWVLGCESISLENLNEICNVLAQNGHHVYHEFLNLQKTQSAYLNPLLYVFWCRKPDHTNVLTFIIQFKTTPCRDKLDIEQRSLQLGTEIYTFNRGINSIGLMSIICSDAFAFNEQLVSEFYRGMMLIHIQLNPKPADTVYSRYRSQLLDIASNSDVELLCLNWAGNIREATSTGKIDEWENNAGSAYYAPPGKFKPQDQIVTDGHMKGFYYSRIGYWHAFYLDQEPHIIKIQKQKIMAHGAPVMLSPTTFATVANRWTWDSAQASQLNATNAVDGFRALVSQYPNVSAQLMALSAQNPLAVERALEMLVGAPKRPSNWFQIESLESMNVTENENLRRVTVHQDYESGSNGTIFRKQRLQAAETAAILPGNNVPWPPPLKDLENGYTYLWSHSDPYTNISSFNGSRAGLVYLGEQAIDDDVLRVYKILSEGIYVDATKKAMERNLDVNDTLTKCRDRFCVVYRRNNKYHVWWGGKELRIDLPPGASAFDITGEQ